MENDAHMQYLEGEEGAEVEDNFPVEELIPNSVRYGLDPQTLAKPLDPTIYGYDIATMKERPWAKEGVDTSDYFNYGFDEDSWRAYCALQSQGIHSLRARADKFIAEILGKQANSAAIGGAAGGGFQHTPHHYGNNREFGGGNSTYQPREHREPREQSKYYKTHMCQGFLTGTCPREASACNFAHGQHELRPYVHSDRPDYRQGGGGAPMQSVGGLAPPPVPIPSALPSGISIPPPPPHMLMGGMHHMPPPQLMGGAGVLGGGEGVLSAPPPPPPFMQTGVAAPPQQQPVTSVVPQVAKSGPSGFRILPQQKRDREKSPDNVTY